MESRPQIHRKFVIYSVLGILILATGLRFYNLGNRGIFDYDEAWYLLEAKSLHDALQFVWQKATETNIDHQSLKEYLRERGTVPITTFKPGHTFLTFLGMLCFGVHDYAGFSVSAILGTLTVYLIYSLTKRLYGVKTGLLAALILAISPFHIGYSRSGYAQANAIFFVALGLYLWYGQARDEKPFGLTRLFLSGCAIGYAFTCHFNLFIIPPLFLAYEAIHTICKRHDLFSSVAKRLGLFSLGMATPLLLFELPARILRLIGRLPEGQQTYLEQSLYRMQPAGEVRISFSGAPAFLEKLAMSDGFWIVIGLAVAILYMALRLKKLTVEDRLVLSLLLIPALPWTTLSAGFPPFFRTFAVLCLSVSILAATGLMHIEEYISTNLTGLRRVAFPLVCLFTLANGLFHVKDLLPAHSGYQQATDEWLDYIRQNGGRIAFLPGSVWPTWHFYLSARYDDLPPEVRQFIQFYSDKKDAMPPQGDFDAFDFKRYYRGLNINQPQLMAYFDRIRDTYRPVVRVLNPVSDLPIAYSEVGGDRERRIRNKLSQMEPSKYIEIYDLRLKPGEYHSGISAASQTDVRKP